MLARVRSSAATTRSRWTAICRPTNVVAAGQRRVRRQADREGRAASSKSRCTSVMEELAEQIAADGEGARKLIMIARLGFTAMKKRASRSRHRQFAAGEDGDRRQRSELGPHSVLPPDILALFSIRLTWPCSCNGCRFVRAVWRPTSMRPSMKAKLGDSQVRIRIVHAGKGHGEARVSSLAISPKATFKSMAVIGRRVSWRAGSCWALSFARIRRKMRCR